VKHSRALLSCVLLLLLLASPSAPVSAAPHASQTAQSDGQAYVVQPGDTLVKIAARFYGSGARWRDILNGTNAKAASDPSFARISNPNLIRIGQKLWLPGAQAAPTPPPTPTPPPAAQNPPPAQSADQLRQAYDAAVRDAEVAEPSEISRDLTAIVESNDKLQWEGQPGSKRVLLATWTSFAGYNDLVGKSYTVPEGREIWFTASPVVRDFCSAYQKSNPGADLTLRLRQLLGLPPDDPKTIFVEMWVNPSDVFRPSPDPEITDHEAELDFPNSSRSSVSQAHMDWINNLKQKSYGPKGYPWTRLGYTYDWGNPNSEVGPSEFVIASGVTVDINKTYTTADYCK
jgi:LysM repeat protein